MARLLSIACSVVVLLCCSCEQKPRVRPTGKVSFGLSHQTQGKPPVHLQLADGEVEIDEAVLVVSAFELHLCPGKEGRRLSDLLVPPVYAHVASSGTRLGVPYAETLLENSGAAKMVGEIAPPLGTYCRGYAVVAPADTDVVNISGIDTADLVGSTLVVRGRLRPEGAGEWADFTSATDARRAIPFDLSDPKTGERPLRLKHPGADAFIVVAKDTDASSLQALRLADFHSSRPAGVWLDAMAKTFHMRVFSR